METCHRAVSASSGEELIGSMLVGLVESLRNVNVISGEEAASLVEGVESNDWYPMSIFFSLLDEIREYDEVDIDPILFRAGTEFVEDFFRNCGARELVSCADDFIRLQDKNGGYSHVHRGDPHKIGWQELLEFDPAAGYAKLVCITPYPREFERGIFHRGMLMAGDVDYVRVESVEEPYNLHLSKKTITIRFHRRPEREVADALDAILSRLSPGKPASVPERLSLPLAWRLKAIEEQYLNDSLFFEQSGRLMSKAANKIYELSKRLDRLAHRDELTGLLNRRAILGGARNILALAARQRWPVSFILVDVDHFKSINDTWGHAAGDGVLRSIANIMEARIRDSDLIGRIGGEEFLIVLPETDREGACVLAETLRAGVEADMQAFLGDPDNRITVSLGVAVTEAPAAHEVDIYLMQADEALYASKRGGRNRVTVYAPT